MVKDFREFLLRGNVADLAVAIVIGFAFNSLVTAFVTDFITPLVVAISGKKDLTGLVFHIHGSAFTYGHFLNALMGFVVIAGVVFLLVVRPTNQLMTRRKSAPPLDPVTRDCPECLSAIPEAARRCAFCSSEVRAG
ncbi:MAG: large conductance mechanosensitive channel protein MscL [Chloroflexota bacterium]|nr:large conductance mechanosensitive channel protein MscL [Chloroflexota bacterium]